jgi:multiple sugar transport system substrate-binding protein
MMFSQAGVKAPEAWTWDELITTGKKLVRDTDGDGNKDIWGFGFEGGDPWWFYSYGGDPYNAMGTRMTINNPQNAEALGKMAEITSRGEVHPVWGQSFSPQALFMSSKLAMTVDGPFSLPTFANLDIDWDIAPIPSLNYNGSKIKVDVMTPESYSIAANTKHPNEAIKLLSFITNKNNMIKYAKIGTIVPTVPSALPTFVSADSSVNRKVFIDAIPNFRMYFYSHPLFTGKLKSIAIKYRNKAYLNQSPPATVLEQIENDSNKLLDEFWANHK